MPSRFLDPLPETLTCDFLGINLSWTFNSSWLISFPNNWSQGRISGLGDFFLQLKLYEKKKQNYYLICFILKNNFSMLLMCLEVNFHFVYCILNFDFFNHFLCSTYVCNTTHIYAREMLILKSNKWRMIKNTIDAKWNFARWCFKPAKRVWSCNVCRKKEFLQKYNFCFRSMTRSDEQTFLLCLEIKMEMKK